MPQRLSKVRAALEPFFSRLSALLSGECVGAFCVGAVAHSDSGYPFVADVALIHKERPMAYTWAALFIIRLEPASHAQAQNP